MKRLVLLLAVTMLICSSALAQASGKGSASARGGAKTEAQIRQLSDELLEVEQGSLYPAVYRIEQRGWISSKWGVTETGRRAKFYTLTKAGSKRLTVEEESWDRLALAIAKVRNAPSPIHLYSVRRCGDRVIDRLRQCGGHVAGAFQRSAQRDRYPFGCRGGPRAHRQTTADGKSDARIVGRRLRDFDRRLDD